MIRRRTNTPQQGPTSAIYELKYYEFQKQKDGLEISRIATLMQNFRFLTLTDAEI